MHRHNLTIHDHEEKNWFNHNYKRGEILCNDRFIRFNRVCFQTPKMEFALRKGKVFVILAKERNSNVFRLAMWIRSASNKFPVEFLLNVREIPLQPTSPLLSWAYLLLSYHITFPQSSYEYHHLNLPSAYQLVISRSWLRAVQWVVSEGDRW